MPALVSKPGPRANLPPTCGRCGHERDPWHVTTRAMEYAGVGCSRPGCTCPRWRDPLDPPHGENGSLEGGR